MPYDVESYFDPNQALVTRSPGGATGTMSGGGGGDFSQLMALMQGGIGFSQKMAMKRLQMMQNAAKLQKMQAELDMRQKEFSLGQAKKAELGDTRGSAPKKQNYRYTKNIGGMNQVPGAIRAYGSDPGAVFGGITDEDPQGSANFQVTPAPQQQFNEVARQNLQLQSLAMDNKQQEQDLNDPFAPKFGGGADWYGLKQVKK